MSQDAVQIHPHSARGRDARAWLSVIVPTLNEARSLGAMLDALRRACGTADVEVIIVDGGSRDATAEVARTHGARVVTSECGRGAQMRAGARAARGASTVLWFLHADTIPPTDALALIRQALLDARVVGGNFTLRFDGARPAARLMTWLYPQLRRLGLCYGDSAFFVRRSAYEAVGGFRAFPLFEDLDLARRLKRRGRFVCAPGEVITSSRRFEEGRSFALAFARWATLQVLYWIGVPPRTLCRLYAPVRSGHGRSGEREDTINQT